MFIVESLFVIGLLEEGYSTGGRLDNGHILLVLKCRGNAVESYMFPKSFKRLTMFIIPYCMSEEFKVA